MTLYDDLLKMHVPVDTVHDDNGCFFATLRVGSNCPQGGDAGHGGRTLIEHHGIAALLHTAAGLLKNRYVPCLDSPEPQCERCMFRQQHKVGQIRAKSMPFRVLMQQWKDAEEEFERSLAEDFVSMEEEFQSMSPRSY